MEEQVYNWTCSVASFTWVINATGTDPSYTREEALNLIGYPQCVNEVYGLMDINCLISAFANFGLVARQAWVTFDQAYSIMAQTTGVINPVGMYHFMAIRGVNNGDLWVANSAPGYKSVWDVLDRNLFNSLGPVQILYLVP